MTPYRLNLLRRHGLAVFVALALLAGCAPPATPVPPGPPTEPTGSAGSQKYACGSVNPECKPEAAVAGAHYILNQVIITGPAEAIDALVTRQNALGAGLQEIQNCVLGQLVAEQPEPKRWSEQSEGRGGGEDIELPEDVRARLVTRLYSLKTTRSVEELIVELNKEGRDQWVFADPNYLTGPLEANPISPCGVKSDPFEVGGSPFEVGGSSPGGWPAPADAASFQDQWAFDKIDLGKNGRGRGELTGEGVRVAVFDTSPFTPGQNPGQLPVPINLTVTFPTMANELPPAPAPSGAITYPITVADHGLFAAGLVYAVAPRSEIHLVRVLNEYGCGDLWTLNDAINEWVAQQTREEKLEQVVLNLSLGVHQPRDLDKVKGWPAKIVSLDEALRNANVRGAVIVAASGNDSYDSTLPRPMHLPADWRYVIGVAASNRDDGRACYSNVGDVVAPGADGGPWTDGDGITHSCQPISHTCLPYQSDCPFGVVSLSTEYPSGYRFWVGTSFAAPLVSGQAALLASGGLDADTIKSCIQTNTRAAIPSGLPIVSVADSIQNCVP